MNALMNHLMRSGIDTAPFEQMNALPVSASLREMHDEILPGHRNTWYEYVPACYDGKTPVPLVVQVHGGGQDGARWADYTIWHLLAEEHNFIVVYPNSLYPGTWNCEDEDVEWLRRLILRMGRDYAIDTQRVYMTGMSNGDMMTLAFSMKHPEMLAAAAFMTGPSAKEMLENDQPIGALPILQMRAELDVNWHLTPETKDVYANRYEMNDLNRALWATVNGTENVLPRLSIRGKDNFLYFPGTRAPIINWEIRGMGHREPVYSAQVTWDRLFSWCTRTTGKDDDRPAASPVNGCDDDLVILAVGSRKAWLGDHAVDISPLEQGVLRVIQPAETSHFCPVFLGEMCETEAYYAPVELLSTVWHASVTPGPDGASASICLADGRTLSLYNHSLLYQLDGVWHALQKPCIRQYGSLYFPVEELMQVLYPLHITAADDVLCLSGHYAELGRYTARIMSRLLGGNPRQRHENAE